MSVYGALANRNRGLAGIRYARTGKAASLPAYTILIQFFAHRRRNYPYSNLYSRFYNGILGSLLDSRLDAIAGLFYGCSHSKERKWLQCPWMVTFHEHKHNVNNVLALHSAELYKATLTGSCTPSSSLPTSLGWAVIQNFVSTSAPVS